MGEICPIVEILKIRWEQGYLRTKMLCFMEKNWNLIHTCGSNSHSKVQGCVCTICYPLGVIIDWKVKIYVETIYCDLFVFIGKHFC